MREDYVQTSRFGLVSESELHRLNKDHEERMKKQCEEAIERLRNTNDHVLCPLSGASAMNNACRGEKCAWFVDDACSLAKIAKEGAVATTGKRCPILKQKCHESCALNIGGGCIITAFWKE